MKKQKFKLDVGTIFFIMCFIGTILLATVYTFDSHEEGKIEQQEIKEFCEKEGYKVKEYKLGWGNRVIQTTCFETKGNKIIYHTVKKQGNNYYFLEEK